MPFWERKSIKWARCVKLYLQEELQRTRRRGMLRRPSKSKMSTKTLWWRFKVLSLRRRWAELIQEVSTWLPNRRRICLQSFSENGLRRWRRLEEMVLLTSGKKTLKPTTRRVNWPGSRRRRMKLFNRALKTKWPSFLERARLRCKCFLVLNWERWSKKTWRTWTPTLSKSFSEESGRSKDWPRRSLSSLKSMLTLIPTRVAADKDLKLLSRESTLPKITD